MHYSLAAGERALAGYAHEEAQAHFQRALAAKAGQTMDEQAAALLHGLGRAEMALTLWEQAAAHLGSALTTMLRPVMYHAARR